MKTLFELDRQDLKDVFFRANQPGEVEISVDGEKTWLSGTAATAENISGWTRYRFAGYSVSDPPNGAVVLKPGANEIVVRYSVTGEIDTHRHIVKCTPYDEPRGRRVDE